MPHLPLCGHNLHQIIKRHHSHDHITTPINQTDKQLQTLKLWIKTTGAVQSLWKHTSSR